MSNYKKTLHLPKTTFPMKANLSKNEPVTLQFWEKVKAYDRMNAVNNQKGTYVLHDGPPYANGNIHLGTALNKVLKDIIVKSKNLAGYKAEYVPGWDCHGLPIEHKVEKELGSKKDQQAKTIRQACRDYATKFVDIQREEFKRLGVFGVWDDPYLTMRPAYEAATARELGNFMGKGAVFRGKKPIHWCLSCQTALAEAEVEYADHTSPSIYVRFPLPDAKLTDVFSKATPDTAYIVIWTTTPWTLPDNMAVAVHPEFSYVLLQHGESQYVLAEDLVENFIKVGGMEDATVLEKVNGDKLENLQAEHPFYDRKSPVVLADYVTLETGTGCVHTAPGHGRDDYETGLKYGLEVLSPLNDAGEFLPSVEYFAGLNVWDANPKVIALLKERGHLVAEQKITHSYPHCWRCKEPVIFRATTQWFISIETNQLRVKALDAINNAVTWIPSWGKERIHNMIAMRPDWCISRQRFWGVPILALLCEDCDTAWFESDWVHSIVDKFADYPTGCDYWFDAPMEDIVPEGLKCPHCGGIHWKKETDILDVWFDSGTSFAAVCEQRPECTFPADMYLEGSDQHRGWFHSSMLAAMGTRGCAPYRSVLTHGYVVDGEGKKQSKSVGNVVAPHEIIDKYGAEILRIWVASVDYREDIRISDEILSRLIDAYRRIRNTCRFILGNLNDFTPENAIAFEEMLPLDRYALSIAGEAQAKMAEGYEAFEFYKTFHTLHNLCVTELSAFYLDIIKDRLYVSGKDSNERRSAQTALWKILLVMLQGMAPILSFTSEEAYQHLPDSLKIGGHGQTIFATTTIDPESLRIPQDERTNWDTIAEIRSEVTKAIEPYRKSGTIGHSLDARVLLYMDEALQQTVAASGANLKEVLIVSKVELLPLEQADDQSHASEELPGLKVGVFPAGGEKCARCWTLSEELGSDPRRPDICPRCAAVIKDLPLDDDE